MTTIGFDLGTHCGWAVCREGMIVSSDCRDFERGEYGYGHLFNQFRKLVMDLRGYDHLSHQPIVWAYEAPHFRGGPATRITVGMSAHLMELAHRWGETCQSVHTATLKKFSTGSGRAGKPAMMAQARLNSRMGGEMSEHEADAILVALWAAKQREEV